MRCAPGLVVVVVVAVVVIVACSSPPARPTAAPRTIADGTCADVAWSCAGMKPNSDEPWGCVEGDASQRAQYEATCTPEKDGRFALNACLRDDVVAGCTVARGAACTTTWYLAPASRDTIEAECAEQGGRPVAP